MPDLNHMSTPPELVAEWSDKTFVQESGRCGRPPAERDRLDWEFTRQMRERAEARHQEKDLAFALERELVAAGNAAAEKEEQQILADWDRERSSRFAAAEVSRAARDTITSTISDAETRRDEMLSVQDVLIRKGNVDALDELLSIRAELRTITEKLESLGLLRSVAQERATEAHERASWHMDYRAEERARWIENRKKEVAKRAIQDMMLNNMQALSALRDAAAERELKRREALRR